MGVEYRHFLVPENPTFIPGKNITIKVDAVLEKWKLKGGAPKVHDLTNGTNQPLSAALNELDTINNIALKYPQVEGKVVRDIMGESIYDEIEHEERYLQSLTLIAGTDFRIHPSGEQLYIEIIKPPTENGKSIVAYCEYDAVNFCHDHAYTASPNATAPQVKVEETTKGQVIGNQNFSGFWRTALIIDCGKDLPEIRELPFFLPNTDFIADMEQAFETRLLQIGEVY